MRLRVGLVVVLLVASGSVGAQAQNPSERIYIDDGSPSWSPDGKRIVFARHRGRIDPRNGECCLPLSAHLYVMNAGGRNLRRVGNGRFDSDPQWSSEGRIAFVRRARGDGRPRLFVMRADGTGARPLRAESAFQLAPAWSPDGEEIAYWRGASTAHLGTIQVLRPGTAASRRIVDRADRGSYGGPSWSPDAERLLFTRYFDVYVANADGSNVRRLTRSFVMSEYEPTWSPRGDRIVFRSELGLYVMRPDGTRVRRITRAPNELEQDANPAWSPSGRWIVFSATRGRSHEKRIYRVRPDGRGLKRLTAVPRR